MAWNEENLIRQLRSEAEAVKQCFTTFSYQAVALGLTVLGASLVGLQQHFAGAAYLPLPVIVLLLAVCRIGIFKYSTANRHNGYELHLARAEHLSPAATNVSAGVWSSAMREIRWEEAMRAWRIVQPTLFRAIYATPNDALFSANSAMLAEMNPFRRPLYRIRPKIQNAARDYLNAGNRAEHSRRNGYPWFLPGELVKVAGQSPHATAGSAKPLYHAGSYLKHMLIILISAQFLMLIPLAVLIASQIVELPASQTGLTINTVVLAGALVVMFKRMFRVRRRREIIEEELLSIHSCAIVWQAVVLAHYRALDSSARNPFEHYTEALAREAIVIASDPLRLPQWLESPGLPPKPGLPRR